LQFFGGEKRSGALSRSGRLLLPDAQFLDHRRAREELLGLAGAVIGNESTKRTWRGLYRAIEDYPLSRDHNREVDRLHALRSKLMPMLIAADRLRRLLGAGYFPTELPPPFTTFSFALKAGAVIAQIDSAAAINVWTIPESFNIPRWGQARRKLSIVNPINQLMIGSLIAENWDEIKSRLARSRISEFRPGIVSHGGRAVTGVDFDGVQRRRAEILARYGRYVKADISRFYASVYTHSIPWALLGKEWVKSNINKPEFKKHFSNELDKALRAGNNGQTTGIPIGPDTLRIISEIVACGFEDNVIELLPDIQDRGVRYVDDMIIGLEDSETPDAVLAAISTSLYEYELDLNIEKTSVHGLGAKHAPEWMHFLKRFQVSLPLISMGSLTMSNWMVCVPSENRSDLSCEWSPRPPDQAVFSSLTPNSSIIALRMRNF
jgi:Reverse transcriptase (RNA-dependent DNA polymerase)